MEQQQHGLAKKDANLKQNTLCIISIHSFTCLFVYLYDEWSKNVNCIEMNQGNHCFPFGLIRLMKENEKKNCSDYINNNCAPNAFYFDCLARVDIDSFVSFYFIFVAILLSSRLSEGRNKKCSIISKSK